MAQPAQIDPQRPDGEQTRTELTLARIGLAWRHESRGQQFTGALLDFLRSLATQSTLKSYSFSILEFFDWYQRKYGRLATPADVRRADAVEFNKWLRTRKTGLEKWRLEHDPTRKLDLAIFEIVSRTPGTRIDDIRQALGRFSEFTVFHEGQLILAIEHPNVFRRTGGLAQRLACLVKARTLTRSPSISEIRRGAFDAGLKDPSQAAITEPIPPEVFSYRTPEVQTPEGADRASGIAARLTGLSSFWEYMMNNGENQQGASEPLLRFNVWAAPLKEASRQAPSHQAASRARKTPNFALFLRILATTFYHTYGPGEPALRAAEAAFWGKPLSAPLRRERFNDVRDRALLIFMAQTGARATEVGRLKNRDVAGDPPVVSVLGKRGKRRALLLAPPARSVIQAMRREIAQIARSRTLRGERAATLLDERAPLLPAVSYWGANNWKASETGLTRPGIAMVLRRRAERAGIEPGSADFARAHPHGLRHLFAKIAADSGTPVNRIQAMMGHASAATTGRYMEERDPEKLVIEAFRDVARVVTQRAECVVEEIAPLPPEVSVPSIHPPSMPKARPVTPRAAKSRQAPVRPLKERFPEPMARVERRPLYEEVAEGAFAEAPPGLPLTPSGLEADINAVAVALGEPIDTIRRQQVAEQCGRIQDESLRKLCLIYLLHWGEEGNVQALKKSGGRLTRQERESRDAEKKRKAERDAGLSKLGLSFQENPLTEEEETEFDDEEGEELFIPTTLEELEAMEAAGELAPEPGAVAPLPEMIAPGERIIARAGSDKTKQMFFGKQSGLTWWYGTGGALRPQMPVMSPAQVGNCTAAEQDEICAALISLWHKWFTESDTKAEALVAWVAEAIDAAAQLSASVMERGGEWRAPAAPWEDTALRGTKRRPEPRLVFREHLPKEVVNWFTVVAWQYTISAGGPEGEVRGAQSKVRDQQPPDWYKREDPVLDLPPQERATLIDWIVSLTGQGLPSDSSPLYPVKGSLNIASRAQVAALIESMCSFGRSLDAMRAQPKGGPWRAATYLKATSLADLPIDVRAFFEPHEEEVERAMYSASGGTVADFDIRSAYRDRPERMRVDKFMAIARDLFGEEAFHDSALRNVARCGRIPLSGFRDLFNIENGTVKHDEEFKQAFAARFGTHSECVARRAIRELWELKKARPDAEAIRKPVEMVNLVQALRAYRVPCTELQAMELKFLVRRADVPGGIYSKWKDAKTISEEPRYTEAEELERGIQEEYRHAIGEEFVRSVFTPNQRKMLLALPTPLHFLLALR